MSKPTFTDKVKDYFTKGFQLQKVYTEDWLAMKDTFKHYGLDINDHGPIITLNEAKTVNSTAIIVERLYNDDTTRLMVEGYLDTKIGTLVKGKLFLTILRVIPRYGRIKTEKDFEKWLTSDILEKLISIEGTIKNTDIEFENIIRKLIK